MFRRVGGTQWIKFCQIVTLEQSIFLNLKGNKHVRAAHQVKMRVVSSAPQLFSVPDLQIGTLNELNAEPGACVFQL